jgi:hypothetical protein
LWLQGSEQGPLQKETIMMKAGFIHFDCLCGLDIYFFGDLASCEPPYEEINTFRARLVNHQHAIFTSRDKTIVSCPCCESLIQLPSAQVAAYLGQMSLATANRGVETRKALDKKKNDISKIHSDGFRPQFSKLN